MRSVLTALADAANVSKEEKLNILGEFDLIDTPSLPVTWPKMVFVAKLKTSEADLGTHQIQLRVLDEDMHLVAVIAHGTLIIPENSNPGIESGLPFIVPIHYAHFARTGTYLFQLAIDAQVCCEAQLHIRLLPPAPPADAPA
jgi:hypothetical protein